MHCLKNVSYSLNLVLYPGDDTASRSMYPFRMLVHRYSIGKRSVLSTCFHNNSKILKLLKLLMSMAFGQNGPDLKIEKLLSSQAVSAAWQQTHT